MSVTLKLADQQQIVMESAWPRRSISFGSWHDGQDREGEAKTEGNCGGREGVDIEGLQISKYIHAGIGTSISKEYIRQK